MATTGKFLIFAGAGISQESGLKTFRDSDGLWNNYDVMKICNYQKFIKDRKNNNPEWLDVFDFYNMRKSEILAAKPNDAHYVIAEWQQRFGTDRVVVVTSNIDDLFEKAGCANVVHVHGTVDHMKCTHCEGVWFIGDAEFEPEESCPFCGCKKVKPNVVFFGENAPEYRTMAKVFSPKTRKPNDTLFYIGSSMQVLHPVHVFGGDAHLWEQGDRILIDTNANALAVEFPYFNLVVNDTASSALTALNKHVR